MVWMPGGSGAGRGEAASRGGASERHQDRTACRRRGPGPAVMAPEPTAAVCERGCASGGGGGGRIRSCQKGAYDRAAVRSSCDSRCAIARSWEGARGEGRGEG